MNNTYEEGWLHGQVAALTVAARRICPFGPRPDDDPVDAEAWDVLQFCHEWLLEMASEDIKKAFEQIKLAERKAAREQTLDEVAKLLYKEGRCASAEIVSGMLAR